jgi:hypothetical protein
MYRRMHRDPRDASAGARGFPKYEPGASSRRAVSQTSHIATTTAEPFHAPGHNPVQPSAVADRPADL